MLDLLPAPTRNKVLFVALWCDNPHTSSILKTPDLEETLAHLPIPPNSKNASTISIKSLNSLIQINIQDGLPVFEYCYQFSQGLEEREFFLQDERVYMCGLPHLFLACVGGRVKQLHGVAACGDGVEVVGGGSSGMVFVRAERGRGTLEFLFSIKVTKIKMKF